MHSKPARKDNLNLGQAPRILLAGEQPGVAQTVANILRKQYRVDVAPSVPDALQILGERAIDVLLIELSRSEAEWLRLLSEVRRRSPLTPCIVLTSQASLEAAVAALRHGAYDFLVKPVVIEDLEQTLARAVSQRRVSLIAAQRERALRDLNDRLEERVRERTAELMEANRRLGEALDAKDRFLAVLSHELRTPLTPMRAGLDLLKVEAAAPLKPVVEAMERNLAQETRLIDDLLDIARISTGKLTIEKRAIDLTASLQAARDMLAPRAEAKGQSILLEVRTPIPTLLADPVRLQQVVANLLDNAVKFAPSQGQISLAAWCEAGRVIVQVSDQGPGIDPTFLPHVFEPFRQADCSSRRRHGGLGLGLAIARQLMVLHDGALEVHNLQPGPGACFTCSFPLLPAAPEPAVQALPRVGPLGLLLVDDSLDTIQVLGTLLKLKGMHVREAANVPEALQQIEAEAPDVIVTDIGMPGEDGYDLLRRLQAHERWRHIPVVAATGYVGSQEQEQMAHAGFAAALSKPFDVAELLAVLERISPSPKD